LRLIVLLASVVSPVCALQFEYIGDDFEADSARIGNDPVTKQWWAVRLPVE